jgi:hypothetical protein
MVLRYVKQHFKVFGITYHRFPGTYVLILSGLNLEKWMLTVSISWVPYRFSR